MKKRRMTAAEAMVHCFKEEEVEKVFCVPGESYLPLLDALYDEKSIRVISARHESGAGFMAEGYAKGTNKPSVVLVTRGVGAANLSIAVHTAYQDSTPMVVIIGQIHSRFLGREGFQEIDLVRFFEPISKWAVEINDHERIFEILHRAFYTAKSGRPGPVMVSVPEDIFKKIGTYGFYRKTLRPKPAMPAAELLHFKQLLEQAEKPIIIAGGGVKSAGAEDELIKFSEKLSVPVVVAFRRHDVFPNHHPLYGGHLGLGTPTGIIEKVKEADLVLVLGARLSEVTTQDYQLISPKQTLIHIDIDEKSIGKVYPPALGIQGDVKEVLMKAVMLELEVAWKEWARSVNSAYKKSSNLMIGKSKSIYAHVLDILVKTLPEDAVITNDAGNFAGWLHQYYPFQKKHTYIGPASGAMGYGLPAAIGAKLAFPEKLVVSLSGDGGAMMTIQELETAVRYKIPIISLIFNNQMYGTIRMHQEIHYPKRVIATDLGKVSFKDLAVSLGAKGYTVSTRSGFQDALLKCLTLEKPCVIEIIADKEQISVNRTITDLQSRK